MSWINLSASAVLEEGAGAVVSALASSTNQPKTQNIFIDLGNSTIISSVFGSGGKLVARKVTSGGVDALIEAIAKKHRHSSSAHEGRQ
ncbi:hypothetical protein [Coleofasciculus sp. FACHB-SPT9]|uniref:hypothetical protein n=1 Tax=Cyanophyceae TaxID=3028117 RepID=UPI0016898756|nr:hypothetical protein [Coleofasciculus sp. FACHB-SPT9]MBD1889688.1 hypothetical protein [Coleofasciculus sp. FACHB-SPT9]